MNDRLYNLAINQLFFPETGMVKMFNWDVLWLIPLAIPSVVIDMVQLSDIEFYYYDHYVMFGSGLNWLPWDLPPAWSKPEHAIAQRQKAEDYERHFTGYTRELQAIHRNTKWHETYEKYAIGKRNARNENGIQKELTEANSELKMLRNKRL